MIKLQKVEHGDKIFPAMTRIIQVLLRWRKFIYANVIAVTLFSLVLVFVVKPKYTAVATFQPVLEMGESQQGTAMALSMMLGGGMVSPGDIYIDILKSRIVQDTIIRKFNLVKKFNTSNIDKARKRFSDIVKFKSGITGMVRVEVTLDDPVLAADIANALVARLDQVNREIIMTKGKEMRIFLENRLKEAEEELRESQEKLSTFQEKHKVMDISQELQAAISTYSDLKAQELSKEIQLQTLLKVVSPDHPQVRQLEIELNTLKQKLKQYESMGIGGFGAGINVPLDSLPSLAIQYANLKMDLEIKTKVYSYLVEQYEQARVLEAKDTPTLQVIDKAVPPQLKSWPKRKLFVIGAFLISVIFSLLLAFILDFVDRIYTDPSLRIVRETIEKIKGDWKL